MRKEQVKGIIEGLQQNFTQDELNSIVEMLSKANLPAKNEPASGGEQLIVGMTNFTDGPNVYIGDEWLADDTGIYYSDGKHAPVNVSTTPMAITARVLSIDGRGTRYQLEYKDEELGKWMRSIVEAEALINPHKVMGLSSLSINFSGKTAGALCEYFKSCIGENRYRHSLKCITASSKLGWHNGKFLPYDCDELVFDGEADFPGIIDALKEHGDRDKWYQEFKKIRGREAVDFMTAGVLAAPLIKLIGTDGFVCDLYGDSGTGKSITNQITASIWGNSDILVATGVTTLTASETKMSILNNLPFIVDDMNNITERARGEFIQGLVMQASNGMGKARGKKDGGVQDIKRWKTTTILTSEFSITNQFKNAGAFNRVISCNIGSLIYSKEELDTLPWFFRDNYGFAGRDFIKAIEKLGLDNVKKIYIGFNNLAREKAAEYRKSDRQATSLAYMLTADKIATDYVFHDGKYIDIEKAMQWLEDDEKVNTSARFYTTLMDTISANGQHFEGMAFDEGDIKEAQENNRTIRLNTEYWGRYDGEKGFVYVMPYMLKKLANKEGADLELFYRYCIDNGLMQKNRDNKKATTYHSFILIGEKGQHKAVKGWKIKLPKTEKTEEEDMTPFERADIELERKIEEKGEPVKVPDDFPFDVQQEKKPQLT